MKCKLLAFCSIFLLNGCTNPVDPLHNFTNQLGLTNSNSYVPQAQVNFALPNNWQTDVVRVKSVDVKQAPAPKGTYITDDSQNSNNPILNEGVDNQDDSKNNN